MGACTSSPGQFWVPQAASTLFLRQNLPLHLKLISLAELAKPMNSAPQPWLHMYSAAAYFYMGSGDLNSALMLPSQAQTKEGGEHSEILG